MGASNEMGEWEAWIKAGTGDDKTDIVVIADFWQRTGGVFSRDRDISSNGNFIQFGGFDAAAAMSLAAWNASFVPRLFFSDKPLSRIRLPMPQPPHFIKDPFAIAGNSYFTPNGHLGDGNYFFYNFASVTPALPPGDRQCTTARSRAICATSTLQYLATLNMRARISIRRWQRCRLRRIHSGTRDQDCWNERSERHQCADPESV